MFSPHKQDRMTRPDSGPHELVALTHQRIPACRQGRIFEKRVLHVDHQDCDHASHPSPRTAPTVAACSLFHSVMTIST
jgi:hypothetical protein